MDAVARCIGVASVALDHLLPGDIVGYLMPSRYCPVDEFQSFAADEFGAFEGGARIVRNEMYVKNESPRRQLKQ